MDHVHGEGVNDLFQVQCHLYKHILGFIDSMSIKCAIQLGIPDIIHKHGQPISNDDFRNFVQGVLIPLRKIFGSFWSVSGVSGRFGKYRPKFNI